MEEDLDLVKNGVGIHAEKTLRSHFSAGGYAKIVGTDQWYRQTGDRLEVLSSESNRRWAKSQYADAGALVRNEPLIACAEPEVSKRMREDDSGASDYKLAQEADERERQRKADDEQVRRDVGAPPVMKKINPCRCDGCERTKNGVSFFHTQFTPHGMVAVIAAHGDILLQLVPVNKVIELRDEINRWLDGAA